MTGVTTILPILGQSGVVGRIAHAALGPGSAPVRAVLFDKNRETNWALGWHQDRAIVVKARYELAGFGAWTVKQGEQHVAPPFSLLARMVTVRIHLDDVPASNAPLLIAVGSHRAGLIPVTHIVRTVQHHDIYACTAQAGDVWLYSTPILHASDRAAIPTRRRVLQVDYSADLLPGGLEWLGLRETR